jgi:hypothetical protein
LNCRCSIWRSEIESRVSMRLKGLSCSHSHSFSSNWLSSSPPGPTPSYGRRSPTLMIILISSAKASRMEQDKQHWPTLDTTAELPTCEHQARANISFEGEPLASTIQTAKPLLASGGDASIRSATDFGSKLYELCNG